jgi:hypothetical protein
MSKRYNAPLFFVILLTLFIFTTNTSYAFGTDDCTDMGDFTSASGEAGVLYLCPFTRDSDSFGHDGFAASGGCSALGSLFSTDHGDEIMVFCESDTIQEHIEVREEQSDSREDRNDVRTDQSDHRTNQSDDREDRNDHRTDQREDRT